MHSPLRFCFESWVGLNVAKWVSFIQKNAFASSPISAATVSNAFARAFKKHFRGWWPHEKMFRGSKSKMTWSKCQHASASTLVTSASTWVTEMLSNQLFDTFGRRETVCLNLSRVVPGSKYQRGSLCVRSTNQQGGVGSSVLVPEKEPYKTYKVCPVTTYQRSYNHYGL